MQVENKGKDIEDLHGSKKIYVAPKITEELKKKGCEISRKMVSKYMHEEGIKAIWMKKYRPSSVKLLE
ncbi:MAG: transposase [Leptotrichia sp.]|nr:transposase [Leptotrichia sp.]